GALTPAPQESHRSVGDNVARGLCAVRPTVRSFPPSTPGELVTMPEMSARVHAFTVRAHELIDGLDAWAHRSRACAVVVKVVVTVGGPLVVVVGAAMTVLPGPGLVVIAIGLALLALEYEWARRALRLMGRMVTRARDAALPKDGSGPRRVLGLA